MTLIEKAAFMKSIPLLSTIPTEALADLATRAREIHCDPDEVLFRAGDPNHGTYLVVSGLLQVRRGDALIRVLETGMAFGELWLDEGQPHQYTMVAVEHSHVLNITRDDVFEAIQEYPEFGLGMVRALSLRVHELTSRILDLEKIIARLELELAEHGIEPPPLPPSTMEIPITGLGLLSELREPWPGFAARARARRGAVPPAEPAAPADPATPSGGASQR